MNGMGNPFDGEISPKRLAMMMRDPSQIASFLTEDIPGVEASGAEIFCDMVNVARADVKKLAEVHDVDVTIELMSEDRAAELVAGIPQGEGGKVVEVFNEIAEKRADILGEALTEEEHAEHMKAKVQIMHTADPDTFDVDVEDADGESEIEDGGEE